MIPNSIRSQFPGASNLIYFDTASRGLAPASAKASMDAQIDQHMLGTIEKQTMFDLIERVRGRYASLLRAQLNEIAFTKNVSEGLNMAACALPWRAGDNVVLCPQLEHPSNVYPWLHLKNRAGIEVRTVHSHNGHMPVDAMIAAINDRTRVVTCSYVTFAPGLRTDIERTRRGLCQARRDAARRRRARNRHSRH